MAAGSGVAASAVGSVAGDAGASGEVLAFVKLGLPSVAESPRVSGGFGRPQHSTRRGQNPRGSPLRPVGAVRALGLRTTGHSDGVARIGPGGGLFSAPSHPGSIVSATTFHFRVRNENGWVRRALTTKAPIIRSTLTQEQGGIGENSGGSARGASAGHRPVACPSPARSPSPAGHRRDAGASTPPPDRTFARPPNAGSAAPLAGAPADGAETSPWARREQDAPSDARRMWRGGERKWAEPVAPPIMVAGSGRGIRTPDLRVMSPTSYHCSIPRRCRTAWPAGFLVPRIALDRVGCEERPRWRHLHTEYHASVARRRGCGGSRMCLMKGQALDH